MRLNNTRLELIYNMIANENKQFNCFGDVGTDHAHLPIYLLQQGVCRTAIASDVNVLPLTRAEKNVRKAGYADKITLLLCDGLAKYNVACDVVCTVNVAALNRFEDGAVVDAAALIEAGVIANCPYGLKVLSNGTLTKKITVKAAAFSESAKEKIEQAGGKAEVV